MIFSFAVHPCNRLVQNCFQCTCCISSITDEHSFTFAMAYLWTRKGFHNVASSQSFKLINGLGTLTQRYSSLILDIVYYRLVREVLLGCSGYLAKGSKICIFFSNNLSSCWDTSASMHICNREAKCKTLGVLVFISLANYPQCKVKIHLGWMVYAASSEQLSRASS